MSSDFAQAQASALCREKHGFERHKQHRCVPRQRGSGQLCEDFCLCFCFFQVKNNPSDLVYGHGPEHSFPQLPPGLGPGSSHTHHGPPLSPEPSALSTLLEHLKILLSQNKNQFFTQISLLNLVYHLAHSQSCLLWGDSLSFWLHLSPTLTPHTIFNHFSELTSDFPIAKVDRTFPWPSLLGSTCCPWQ